MKAIQDYYAPEYAHCYGCGPANPHGLKIKSYLEQDCVIAHFTPQAMYSGGYPDHVYGGMLASLLDCHGTASAAAFAYQAQGRVLGDEQAPLRFVTASLKVDFKKPTPLGVELELVSRLRFLEGRKAMLDLSLSAQGQVCVQGEMLAVQIPQDRAVNKQ